MDSGLYVNYLNQPKRAKYRGDLEAVLQQTLQSYVWNSCLSFKKDEPETIPRKLLQCGEKPNLIDEVQFGCADVREEERGNCGCCYRKQACHQHVNVATPYNASSARVATNLNGSITVSRHNGLRIHATKQNLSSVDKLHSRMLKHHHQRRFFPYAKKKFSQRTLSIKQNEVPVFDHDFCFSSKLRPSGHSKLFENYGQLVRSKSLCVVDANALCSCEKVPLPSHEIVSLYPHDCQRFLFRRVLALHLISTLSLKANNDESKYLLHLPASLKEAVELWSKFFSANILNSRLIFSLLDAVQPQNGAKPYKYSLYDKKDYQSRFRRCTSNVLGFQDKICIQTCVDECLSNCEINQSQELIDHCVNTCYVPPISFRNRENFDKGLSVLSMVPEKRISSRLKQKRDSGTLGPYSSDFIFEVPVSKKIKKSKLSHPYSHALFWNFYEINKSSEKNNWHSLALTYHTFYPVLSSHISDEFNSLDGKSFSQLQEPVTNTSGM